MSKWNSYGKRLNEIVERGTKAYREAEKALRDAEADKKQYPQMGGMVNASYAAKAAMAEARYLEAKEKMKAARNMLTRGQTELAALRAEFVAAVDGESVLDASKIDTNSLELLKSGIMTASDYTKMYEDAKASGNHTMMRLIGKYASEAAASESNNSKAATLRVLGMDSQNTGSSEILDIFDVCIECYNRGVTNPKMLDYYESNYKDAAINL